MYPSCRPRSPSPTASGSTACSAARVSAMWSPTAPPGRLVEGLLGLRRAAQDVAVDELHDEEGPLVDGLVGAQPDRLGYRYPGRAQRVHQPVLAHHVVGGGQHVVHRWAAQGPGPSVGVLHPEGQVGASAGDQGECKRSAATRHVVDEPLGDVGDRQCLQAAWTRHTTLIEAEEGGAAIRPPGDSATRPGDSAGRHGRATQPVDTAGRHGEATRLGDRRSRCWLASGAMDVTDATFQADVVARQLGGAGRRRPVGALVRPLHHPRADARAGGGGHRGCC